MRPLQRRVEVPAPPVPSAERRSVWASRLRLVAGALGHPVPTPQADPSVADLARQIHATVDLGEPSHVWLLLAALSGELPDDRTVTATRRAVLLDGPGAALDTVDALTTDASLLRPVSVVCGGVLVDVQHTATTDLATGIQRVARETARRWAEQHECTLVSWTDGFRALRGLTGVELVRMTGESPAGAPTSAQGAVVVIPWASTVLVPELAADPERTLRLLALARHSGNRTGVIGFDTVPVTSATTSTDGFPGFFANHLAAVRHVDRITTISRAAAAEYRGWRAMLPAVGLTGPEIEPILLPAEAPRPDAAAMARARERFIVAGMPMVLCVGTHEPRKNHMAVLHAAEVLWREGHRFSLTFIGGHAWKSERFRERLEVLRDAGRPIESASAIDDDLLWAGYRLARFTVFPSLNEGFGLPAAESLAAGTPVITSGYGSMAEIAADGGALVVDPRDDHSLIDAMRVLLTDDSAYRRLHREARARTGRTWDTYAEETWAYLTAPPEG